MQPTHYFTYNPIHKIKLLQVSTHLINGENDDYAIIQDPNTLQTAMISYGVFLSKYKQIN